MINYINYYNFDLSTERKNIQKWEEIERTDLANLSKGRNDTQILVTHLKVADSTRTNKGKRRRSVKKTLFTIMRVQMMSLHISSSKTSDSQNQSEVLFDKLRAATHALLRK